MVAGNRRRKYETERGLFMTTQNSSGSRRNIPPRKPKSAVSQDKGMPLDDLPQTIRVSNLSIIELARKRQKPSALPQKTTKRSREEKELPKRKPRPRLDHECYVGRDIYFVTICTNRNHHAFVRPDTISGFLYEMYEAAGHTHHSVAAYCVMPDHVHMLLIGKKSDSDMEVFVHRFKQRTDTSTRR